MIYATMDELRPRGERIRRILRHIAKQRGGPSYCPRSSSSHLVIAAHSGAPVSEYDKWRFSTVLDECPAMYYERWLKVEEDRTERWLLSRAYFHLYYRQRHSTDERELICLHCDPEEPDNAPHVQFKRGPHLHIYHPGEFQDDVGPRRDRPSSVTLEAYREILPHAHLALHCGHVDQILESLDTLTYAVEQAMAMIRLEVLDEMRRALSRR